MGGECVMTRHPRHWYVRRRHESVTQPASSGKLVVTAVMVLLVVWVVLIATALWP